MATNTGTLVVAPIKPYDDRDEFPTHIDEFGKGGYRSVADEAARDDITADRRSPGMLVRTLNTGKLWELNSDLTTWVEQVVSGTLPGASVNLTDAGNYYPIKTTEQALQDLGPDKGIRAALIASSGANLVSFSQGGAGSEVRLVSSRFQDTVHLTDFAAPNTGSNVTTKIQQALVQAQGKRLFIPKGVYITGPLPQTQNVEIVGEVGTILRLADNTNSDMFPIAANTPVTLQNLTLDGNRLNQSGNCRGINSDHGSRNITIKNCNISNFYGEAIRIQGGESILITDNIISNCGQPGNTSAIVVRHELASGRVVRIERNTIDSRLSLNGGIKIQSAHPNFSIDRLWITDNEVLLGEVTSGEALGIELFTLNDGAILRSKISRNSIRCYAVTMDGPTPRSFYAYGISLGGGSITPGRGIVGSSISGNDITGCRRISIELIGSHIDCYDNFIEDSAEISISADNVAGGMYGVRVGPHRMRNIGGIGGFYGCIRARAVLQNMYNCRIQGIESIGMVDGKDGVFIIGGNGVGSNIGSFYDLRIEDIVLRGLKRIGVHITSDTKVVGGRIKGITAVFSSMTISEPSGLHGVYLGGRVMEKVRIEDVSVDAASSSIPVDGVTVNASMASSISVTGCESDYCRRGIFTSGSISGLSVNQNFVSNSSDTGILISGSPTEVRYNNNSTVNCLVAENISNTALFSKNEISRLNLKNGGIVVINSGVITVRTSLHPIDTEGGAISDDLDTINGGSAGDLLIICTANSSRDVVVRHGVGNIRLAGAANVTLSHVQDQLFLRKDEGNSVWCEVSYSDNNS